jgi:hypothetical protein
MGEMTFDGLMNVTRVIDSPYVNLRFSTIKQE